MKIVTLHNRIEIDELLHHLQMQLNTLFKEQRQADIDFKIEKYPQPRAQRLHKMSQERRRKALDNEFREQASEGSVASKKAAD